MKTSFNIQDNEILIKNTEEIQILNYKNNIMAIYTNEKNKIININLTVDLLDIYMNYNNNNNNNILIIINNNKQKQTLTR